MACPVGRSGGTLGLPPLTKEECVDVSRALTGARSKSSRSRQRRGEARPIGSGGTRAFATSGAEAGAKLVTLRGDVSFSLGSLALSGALAGLVGVNEIAGVHGRLLLDFVAGAGFAGIAVSLIGRNHPAGIVLAALLFGALYQGGAELAFEIPGFSRDMVFMLQGLIVLFAGAMAQVTAAWLARGWTRRQRRRSPIAEASA